MVKRILSIGLRLGVSVGLLGFLAYLYRGMFSEVAEVLSHARFGMVGCALCMTIGVESIGALRMRAVLRVQQAFLTVWDTFRVVSFGFFTNNFVPSVVGSDAVKTMYLYTFTKKMQPAILGAFADRLFGVMTLVFLASIGVVVSRDYFPSEATVWLVILLFCGICAAIVFFSNQKLARAMKPCVQLVPFEFVYATCRKVYYAFHGYAQVPLQTLRIVLLSIGIQLFYIVTVYVLARSIHVEIFFPLFVVYMIIISFSQLAPSMNGLGVREALFVFLFERHCGAENALAIALLMDMMLIFMGIVGGIVFSLWGGVSFKELSQLSKRKHEENGA